MTSSAPKQPQTATSVVFVADESALVALRPGTSTRAQWVEKELFEELLGGAPDWKEALYSRLSALRSLSNCARVRSMLLCPPDRIPQGRELFDSWCKADEPEPMETFMQWAQETELSMGHTVGKKRLIIAAAGLDEPTERARLIEFFSEWVKPENILLISPSTVGLTGADLARVLRFAGVMPPMEPVVLARGEEGTAEPF